MLFIRLVLYFFLIRFAFIIFENESECADALQAHRKIGGEKVNVSYAFAKKENQKKPTVTESNKNPEQKKQTTPTKKTNKTQQPGLQRTLYFCPLLFLVFCY